MASNAPHGHGHAVDKASTSQSAGAGRTPWVPNPPAKSSATRQWVPKPREPQRQNSETPEFSLWLEPMEDLWEELKKKEIGQIVHKALASMDPLVRHAFVLDLLDHSSDLRKRKPDSLAFFILKEFDAWLRVRPMSEKELSDILTPELRMKAFHLAASAHSNVFDLLCVRFNLQGPDNSFLVSRVRIMLARQQFKEAATCVIKVNLHDSFSLEDICLPLIFQDKANIVEKYVQGHRSVQEALVKQLDVFCQHEFDMANYLGNLEVSVPGVRLEKLRRRHLSKLILRLVKMFKLDMAICPNTAKSKDTAAVRYLLHKRYNEESMDQELWDELVASTIGDNRPVQVEFIDMLMWYNDVSAAARWARHYGIDASECPAVVAEELKNMRVDANVSTQNGVSEESWENELDNETVYDYYPLNLPEDRVVMVSTLDGVQGCLAEIMSKANVVIGIDMEWRPSFSPTQKTKVALCQIATCDTAYLLDMSALWTPQTKHAVKDFFLQILQSEDILKLGFEISGDYRMLGQSFPELQEAVRGERRTIDLSGLGKQILQQLPSHPTVRTSSLGLTDLVFFCFGKYLDKRDRISDWERRPLRQAQVIYAALDAFCLLEIYEHLKQKVSSLGLKVNMEPSLSAKGSKKSKSKAKTKTTKQKEKPSMSQALNQPARGPAMSPGQLAVVCDNMLQGLGRHLRSCGVDVKMLDNDDEHDVCVKIWQQEGRVILTSGAPYMMMKSHVGEGQIMCVYAHKKARHQVQDVLDFFNVVVTPEDIFSRCQVCNGNVYVKVANQDMRRLWHQKKWLLGEPTQGSANHCDDDDLYEDFDGVMICGMDDYDEEDEYESAVHGPSKPSSGKHHQSSLTDGQNQSGNSGKQHPGTNPSHSSAAAPLQNSSTASHSTEQGSQDTADMADFDPESVVSTNVDRAVEADGASSGRSASNLSAKSSAYMNKAPVVYLEDALDFSKVVVGGSGVVLQVDSVPEGILDQVDLFFCCATCGKVFWEGKHFAHVCAQFSHVLERGQDMQGRPHGTEAAEDWDGTEV